MLAAPTTDPSPLRMVLNKIVQPELKEPMKVVDADEAVVVVVTSIDTAEVLEGKDILLRICASNFILTFIANRRSKQLMDGVQLRVAPNSLMNKLVKLSLMPNKRRP